MTCNGKCFTCKFKDCVATYQEISKLDRMEKEMQRKKEKENREVKTKNDLVSEQYRSIGIIGGINL